MQKQKMQTLFQTTCEFLSSLENDSPIPQSQEAYEIWEVSIREFWELVCDNSPSKKERQVFDAVLAFRKRAFEASQKAKALQIRIEPHQWEKLLTTHQIEQRTEEWIREKVNILTASELSDIWAGPGTRARLVLSKVAGIETTPFTQRLAIRRKEGHAMDWGVRYEPVVKQILEQTHHIRITDLGRIRHPTIPRLAASPDGLITEGPPMLQGRLVEIKCPPTRPITEDIPQEYWMQMQLQMEVCDLPACEYVEMKFQEVEASDPRAEGWITLLQAEDGKLQYQYHFTPTPNATPLDLTIIETYGWICVQTRQTTVLRDNYWFASIQKDIEAFWKDVELAREGRFEAPAPRSKIKKIKEVACAIIDTEESS